MKRYQAGDAAAFTGLYRAIADRIGALLIFDDAHAFDEVSRPQAYFIARKQSKIFGLGHFLKIVLLDVQLA